MRVCSALREQDNGAAGLAKSGPPCEFFREGQGEAMVSLLKFLTRVISSAFWASRRR
jgi:hypothetical protein